MCTSIYFVLMMMCICMCLHLILFHSSIANGINNFWEKTTYCYEVITLTSQQLLLTFLCVYRLYLSKCRHERREHKKGVLWGSLLGNKYMWQNDATRSSPHIHGSHLILHSRTLNTVRVNYITILVVAFCIIIIIIVRNCSLCFSLTMNTTIHTVAMWWIS